MADILIPISGNGGSAGVALLVDDTPIPIPPVPDMGTEAGGGGGGGSAGSGGRGGSAGRLTGGSTFNLFLLKFSSE